MPEADVYEGAQLLAPVVISFLLWIAAYTLIIRRGFIDRTCSMPMIALCANFAWEITFGYVYPDKEPIASVNKCWGLVDVVIVYQCLRYGGRFFPTKGGRRLFVPMFVLVQLLSLFCVLTMYHQFDDVDGSITGFGINLMMSGLFLWWALSREDLAGQSIWIGITKGLGTVGASLVQMQLTPEAHFVTFAYFACFLLDVSYVVVLYTRLKAAGVKVWRRI